MSKSSSSGLRETERVKKGRERKREKVVSFSAITVSVKLIRKLLQSERLDGDRK